MNKMYLQIGDWSDDGHGKYEKFLLKTNKSVKEIQEAYKKSVKITGVSFDNNSNKKYQICTEYGESIIYKESLDILKNFINFSNDDLEYFTMNEEQENRLNNLFKLINRK